MYNEYVRNCNISKRFRYFVNQIKSFFCNFDLQKYTKSKTKNTQTQKKGRAHSELNQGPIDLQSIALPLSYTPLMTMIVLFFVNFKINRNGAAKVLSELSYISFGSIRNMTPLQVVLKLHLRKFK